MRFTIFSQIFLCASCLWCGGRAAAQELSVQSISLGPAPNAVGNRSVPEVVSISDDGVHVAQMINKGSRVTVAVNGAPVEELFDNLGFFLMSTSPRVTKRVLFSPGGAHTVFVAEASGEGRVVVNGKPGPANVSLPAMEYGTEFAFSRNGRRYAYALKPLDASGNYQMIDSIPGESQQLVPAQAVCVDGEVGQSHVGVQSLLFSPDSRSLAYIARTELGDVVVRDGKSGPLCMQITRMHFIGADNRLLYICQKAGTDANRMPIVQAMIDEEPAGKPYTQIPLVVVDPAGTRYAYAGMTNPNRLGETNQWDLVLDGETAPAVDDRVVGIDSLTFSSKGARFAYRVSVGRGPENREIRHVAVVDGKPSKDHLFISEIRFSPDERHWAAAMGASQAQFLLLDGEEHANPPHFDSWFFHDIEGPLYFYPRPIGSAWNLVVEGAGDPIQFDFDPHAETIALATDVFVSPDGSQLIYNSRRPQGLVINGVIDSDRRLAGIGTTAHRTNVVFSPDGKHRAYVAQSGFTSGRKRLRLYLDDKAIAEPMGSQGAVSMPRFSLDSRHFAYLEGVPQGRIGTKPMFKLIVDGKEGPTVDTVFADAPQSLRFMDDGTLQFIAAQNGELKRFVIQPGGSLADFPEASDAPKPGGSSGSPVSSAPRSTTGGQKPPTNPGATVEQQMNKGVEKLKGVFGRKKK